MKNKKLFLMTIILISAVFLTALYAVVSNIAKKPIITEGEFPFSITYEVDGETVTINDVYRTYYEGNGGYADTMSRNYVGEIGDMGEGNTCYIIKSEEKTRVELYTHFYADYMMGDSEYEYFDDEPFEPRIYYYDAEEQEYSDEETLTAHGVKLISFEYPEPIKNSFTFSHISYCSGAVVLPALLIAIVALIAIMIFVKKETGLKYKAIDVISIVFNFIISLSYLPLVTILGLFIDIEGGGPEFYYQVIYFIPAFSLLCIAASIALRRKGYRVLSLVVEFVGPVVFMIYLILCGVVELM